MFQWRGSHQIEHRLMNLGADRPSGPARSCRRRGALTMAELEDFDYPALERTVVDFADRSLFACGAKIACGRRCLFAHVSSSL